MSEPTVLQRVIGPGSGFNSFTQKEQGKALTYNGFNPPFSPGSTVSQRCYIIQSREQFEEVAGVSAAAALSASFEEVGVSVEASMQRTWATSRARSKLVVTMYSRVDNAMVEHKVNFDGDRYYNTYTAQEFFNLFGNAYVSHTIDGGLLRVFLIRSQSRGESVDEMHTKVNAACTIIAAGSVESKTEAMEKAKEAFSMENTEYIAITSGGVAPHTLDLTKLLDAFFDFPATVRVNPRQTAVKIYRYEQLPFGQFRWTNFKGGGPQPSLPFFDVSDLEVDKAYALMDLVAEVNDIILKPEGYAWDGINRVTSDQRQQFLAISRETTHQLNLARKALQTRSRWDVPFPDALIRPFNSLPKRTGDIVMDGGREPPQPTGDWNTTVRFNKVFLRPPAVTVSMVVPAGPQFMYAAVVQAITTTGFTVYKMCASNSAVGFACEGFCWTAIGQVAV